MIIDQLIEWLLSKLWLLIIAFWFLAPIFRGQKGRQQQRRRRPTQTRTVVIEKPKRMEAGETGRSRTGIPAQPREKKEIFDWPTFPWDDDMWDEPRPDPKPVERKESSIPKTESERDPLPAFEPNLSEPSSQPVNTPRIPDRKPVSPVYNEKTVTDSAGRSPASIQMSGNEVIKGMIWSQVLGTPRARDPHRTNRYPYVNRAHRN